MNSKALRKKVLFVCSRNQWRSPTAARVFSADPKLEVRSAGTSPVAHHQISGKDIEWANLILCMEQRHSEMLIERFSKMELPPIKVLDIPDEYQYMDPELVELLQASVPEFLV